MTKNKKPVKTPVKKEVETKEVEKKEPEVVFNGTAAARRLFRKMQESN